MATNWKLLLLSIAITALAQDGRGGRNRSDPGSDSDSDDEFDDGFGSAGGRGRAMRSFLNTRQKMIIAHAVLASLAFVLFFPVGAILIRLGKFRGVWLIHGLFQVFAYLVYVAAFGIGIWMVNETPGNLLDRYHPIIGIIVFVLLFFQPILGFIHHLKFKKHSRRTVWSHGHLWLGRIVITLGMINGGLGLLLASEAPAFTGFAPSNGHIIAYSIVAGVMWLLWVAAAIIGERRRAKAVVSQPPKEVDVDESNDSREPEPASPPTYKELYAYRAYP
ncbi:hypothetical protein ACN47E_004090 [Coniothyrium glycines]